MSALQNLEDIKSLFVKGIDYSLNKFSSIIYEKNTKLCDYQKSLIGKAKTLNDIMNVIWMGNLNSVWASCFNAPKPICQGCELQYTSIQYGVGHTGWYFFFGVAGLLRYNLSFFRMEIAPPAVVEEMGIDKSDAVRWLVLGGFGTETEWFSLPQEWVYLKYTQPSYSTFSLFGRSDNMRISLSSPSPMEFNINLLFNDAVQKKPHTLNIELKANTPPTANFPNSCLCGYNLGTFYYSYTDMFTSVSADNIPPQKGTGWVDHQLIKGGIANTVYNQAMQSVGNTLAKKVSPGWLWIAIQDYQSGIQYMFVHYFQKNFYQYDVKLNEKIDMQLANVYNKGITYFSPTDAPMSIENLDVKLRKTIYVPSMNIYLPSEYDITLPGGKKVSLVVNTAPNVYPTAFAPYETPAYLYDEKGALAGIGLIEANFYLSNEQLTKRIITQAGGNSENKEEFSIVLNALEKNQSFWKKFLAFVIVLFPIWFLLAILTFVFYKKEDKKIRLIISIILVIIMYIIVTVYSTRNVL